jgi:hexokinase
VLINDTVGTLMSTAYYDRKTAIGLILGTGTNACYFENIDRIETLENYKAGDQKEVFLSNIYLYSITLLNSF